MNIQDIIKQTTDNWYLNEFVGTMRAGREAGKIAKDVVGKLKINRSKIAELIAKNKKLSKARTQASLQQIKDNNKRIKALKIDSKRLLSAGKEAKETAQRGAKVTKRVGIGAGVVGIGAGTYGAAKAAGKVADKEA